MQPEIFKYHN